MTEAGNITRRVLIGTVWLAGWRIMTRGLGFVSLLTLTHLLVPSDFGIVALASAASIAIESLSQLGVRDALVRLKDDAEAHFDAAFTLQAARGLLTGLILAAGSGIAADWLGDSRLRPILIVLGALSFVSGLENIGTVSLVRNLDFRSQVLLQAVPRVAGVIVTILLAVWLRSYWALIAGLAFSRILTTLSSYLLAPHWPKINLYGWRYLLHFSAWSWGGSIALLVWSRSDPFLIGPAVGAATLGIYAIAAEIALLPVTEMIEPVSSALYSGFAVAHRSGTVARDAALRLAVAIAAIAAPVALALSATSGYVTQALLGPEWATAQPIIAIMSFICILSPFSYVAGTTLSAQGQIHRAFYSNAVSAIIKVTAVITTLALTHDLRAVATTALAVVAFEAGLFTWHVLKASPQPLSPMIGPVMRMLSAGCVTAVVLVLIPGTWVTTATPRIIAFAIGLGLGLAAVLFHCTIHVVLWLSVGKPEGPERDIVDMAKTVMNRIVSHIQIGLPRKTGSYK